VTAWGNETPAVPQGLQVHALATGFEHPRSLYVLPNGDVLVVESNGPKPPINRPKDILTDWVTWFAGAAAKGGNRITLLRDSNGDGIPDLRTVFLDHLNSPFGVALVGNDLYVANTDAIIRYPYQEGQTSITAPGTKLTDLPGRERRRPCGLVIISPSYRTDYGATVFFAPVFELTGDSKRNLINILN